MHFIGNLIFESKESGKILCLDKNRTEETEELTCTGCSCGKENKPELKPMYTEVGVVGGKFVGENQYPWFATVLKHLRDRPRKTGNKTN